MIRRFFNLFLDQLFPQFCSSCKSEGEIVCKNCIKKLVYKPMWQEISGLKVWSAYEYKEPSIASIIMHQWKYNGHKDLITKCIHTEFEFPEMNTYCVFPVPLHKKRQVQRGFNQSYVIANLLNLPINNGLNRIRNTKQQAKLSRSKRLENVKDAFEYKGEAIVGKTVCIVDDVVTTGSTLLACQEALLKAGAGKVYAITMFRALNI